jgi:peptidoglycan/LPS O-acetylase OafA/YrhL
MRRLAWIDALRGYAILGVMTGHLHLFAAGGQGVPLFYVASAIALNYSHEVHPPGTGKFFIRRFFRIFPMFWLAIPLFYFQNLLVGHQPASLTQIIATASVTHWVKLDWINSAVPGSWSIACEVIFYLFFPFVVARISGLKDAAILFFTTIAIAIVCWVPLLHYASWTGAANIHREHHFAYMSFTTQAPCFALGFMSFWAIKTVQGYARIIGLSGLGAIGLLCLVQQDSASLYVMWSIAFAAIAYSMGKNQLSFLVNRTICALGLISYSAYFWHFFMLAVIQWLLPGLNIVAFTMTTLSATIVMSAITYLIIERPMIKFGAALASRKQTVQGA